MMGITGSGAFIPGMHYRRINHMPLTYSPAWGVIQVLTDAKSVAGAGFDTD